MTDRFDACLPFTLAQECPRPDDWSNARNFSHSAHDPGGATMCGIIQREYDTYRKHHGEPVRGVALITQVEGEDIYNVNYWLPYCPMLPTGLDMSFFDSSVNEGTHEAIRILQYSIDIDNDGAWGPITELAIKGIDNVPMTIRRFAGRRSAVYHMTRGDQYFDEDWQRRTTEIRDTSLAMAGVLTS